MSFRHCRGHEELVKILEDALNNRPRGNKPIRLSRQSREHLRYYSLTKGYLDYALEVAEIFAPLVWKMLKEKFGNNDVDSSEITIHWGDVLHLLEVARLAIGKRR
jgi:hypothetical protein